MNARVATMADQATAPELSDLVEWLGLQFAVPDDWQIIRHSLQPKGGRLVLVEGDWSTGAGLLLSAAQPQRPFTWSNLVCACKSI